MKLYRLARKKTSRAVPLWGGFTLVEVLVVLSIISILAGLIGGNYITSRVRARDSERKNNLAQIQRALELYYNDYNQYPSATDGEISIASWGQSFADANGEVYMVQLPSDSRAPVRQYLYETDSSQLKYRLFARLENEEDLNTDLDGDGITGDEFDGSLPEQPIKQCGQIACNYAVMSSNTTITEIY